MSLKPHNITSLEELHDLIDRCIKDLEFISLIPPKHKPVFSTFSYISVDAWFPTFRRRWNGENGNLGVKRINQLLINVELVYNLCEDQDDILDNMYEPEYQIFERKILDIIDALRNSKEGFERLGKTYEDQEDVSIGYIKAGTEVIALAQSLEDWVYTFLIIAEEIEKPVIPRKNVMDDVEIVDNMTDFKQNHWEERNYQESVFDKGFEILSRAIFGNDNYHYDDEFYYTSSSFSDESETYLNSDEQKKIINSIRSFQGNEFFGINEVNMKNSPE